MNKAAEVTIGVPNLSRKEQDPLQWMPLVKHIAKKYYKGYGDFNDLIAYGYLGLLQAMNNFDPNKNNLPITYFYWRISGAMQDGIYKMTGRNFRRVYCPKPFVKFQESASYNLEHKDEELKFIKQQDINDIYQYIKDLQPNNRRFITLYLQGYNITEVAEITGYNKGWISRCYHKIFRILRTRLEGRK